VGEAGGAGGEGGAGEGVGGCGGFRPRGGRGRRSPAKLVLNIFYSAKYGEKINKARNGVKNAWCSYFQNIIFANVTKLGLFLV
jgi:hypothetical protein